MFVKRLSFIFLLLCSFSIFHNANAQLPPKQQSNNPDYQMTDFERNLGIKKVIEDSLAIVSIIPRKASLLPGEPLVIAVNFAIKDKWHIYWRNPGDSGLETKIEFDFETSSGLEFINNNGNDNNTANSKNSPKPFILMNTHYEVPHKHKTDDVTDYVYEGNVTFYYEFAANSELQNLDMINVKIKGNYLICSEICIPKDFESNFMISYQPMPLPNPHWFGHTNKERDFNGETIENKYLKTKKQYAKLDAIATYSTNLKTKEITFEINKNALIDLLSAKVFNSIFNDIKQGDILLFPYENGVIHNSFDFIVNIDNNIVKFTTKIDDYADKFPANLTGILVYKNDWNDKFKAIEINFERK